MLCSLVLLLISSPGCSCLRLPPLLSITLLCSLLFSPRQRTPEPNSSLNTQKRAGLSCPATIKRTILYSPVKGGRATCVSPTPSVAQGNADKHACAMDVNWRSLYKWMYLLRTWVEKLGPVFMIQWVKARMLQDHILTSLINLGIYVTL